MVSAAWLTVRDRLSIRVAALCASWRLRVTGSARRLRRGGWIARSAMRAALSRKALTLSVRRRRQGFLLGGVRHAGRGPAGFIATQCQLHHLFVDGFQQGAQRGKPCRPEWPAGCRPGRRYARSGRRQPPGASSAVRHAVRRQLALEAGQHRWISTAATSRLTAPSTSMVCMACRLSATVSA